MNSYFRAFESPLHTQKSYCILVHYLQLF